MSFTLLSRLENRFCCPVLKLLGNNSDAAAKATWPGLGKPRTSPGCGAAKPRNLLFLLEKPSRAKFFKKRDAASGGTRRLSPGRYRVHQNEKNRAESRFTELCRRRRASCIAEPASQACKSLKRRLNEISTKKERFERN